MVDKEIAKQLHEKGYSHQYIANIFGCSRQYIAHICGKQTKSQFEPITKEQCIYPNLRKWMNENYIPIVELSRRVGYGSPGEIYRILRGVNNPRKKTIDAFLKITGLTYENLFQSGDTAL